MNKKKNSLYSLIHESNDNSGSEFKSLLLEKLLREIDKELKQLQVDHIVYDVELLDSIEVDDEDLELINTGMYLLKITYINDWAEFIVRIIMPHDAEFKALFDFTLTTLKSMHTMDRYMTDSWEELDTDRPEE